MNKRQKAVMTNLITVVIITVITVVGMINIKDWINHSEAMRAMEEFGLQVLQYRKEYGSIPPQSYVDKLISNLPGQARMGTFRYRARWIEFGCSADEILAYSEKRYGTSFFGHGFIILRLDGRVEWMDTEKFEEVFARQKKPLEVQMAEK